MSATIGKIIGSRDLKPCAVCSRRFTPDRVNAHEAICQKSSVTTRKLFDVVQQRIGGTEFEKMAKKLAKTGESLPSKSTIKKGPTTLATNWRQKHAEFLEIVRQSKNAGEGKNGCEKASDLPLAPALNCDDYVQCPHCLRRFNPNAASRHIITCRKMMQERSVSSKDCLSQSKAKLSAVNVAEK